MIDLFVSLLILCLILGVVIYIFGQVPILAPFAWVVNIICLVIVTIFLIHFLLGFGGGAPYLRW